MAAVIIDTNVLVVANTEIREDENGKLVAFGMADHATPACIRTCQNRLKQIRDGSTKVVLDDSGRLTQEYRRYVRDPRRSPPQQQRAGDLFWYWLMQNQWCEKKCTMVHITPLRGNGTEFDEFPNDAALKEFVKDGEKFIFDKDDRKFIAVAIAYSRDTQQTAPILQAVDTKWEGFIEALHRHGVEVEQLCKPEQA